MTELPPHLIEGRAVYERHLPELLAHAGRHALIGDGELVGVYDTSAEAHAAEYDRFLLRPFFVHQIEMVPTVHHLGWYSVLG